MSQVLMFILIVPNMSANAQDCHLKIDLLKVNVEGLQADIISALRDITNKYCKTAQDYYAYLKITEIKRPPSEQAIYIEKCLSSDDKCSYYENQDAIN